MGGADRPQGLETALVDVARMGTDCTCHRGSVNGFVEIVLPALVFLGYSPSFHPFIHPSIHPSNPTFTMVTFVTGQALFRNINMKSHSLCLQGTHIAKRA